METTDHGADPAYSVVIIEAFCKYSIFNLHNFGATSLVPVSLYLVSKNTREPNAKHSREAVLRGNPLGKMSKVLGITKTLCKSNT